MERIVYVLLALFVFKEIVAVFRKDTIRVMNDAITGLGAQWDRDRAEWSDRQKMLYEQLVLKTEQLEEALGLLAELSKTTLKKERAKPRQLQFGEVDRASRMLNGVDRADAVRAPESTIP